MTFSALTALRRWALPGRAGLCPRPWKKGWLGPHGPLDLFLLVRALVSYLFFRHLASWRALEFVLGFLRRRLRWLSVCCWPGAAPSSGATTASADSSTSCTAAAASSSSAPALPVRSIITFEERPNTHMSPHAREIVSAPQSTAASAAGTQATFICGGFFG